MVTLGYTILYVSDVTQSITFYEKAFGFERKFITPEQDYAELNTGSTTLSFASKTLAKSNLKNGFLESNTKEKPFGIEIALVTTDVLEVLEKAVQLGAAQIEAPIVKPWGQTVAYIRDLDGFLIELCTPMQ
jgi:lactoylglutathione lyase